MVRRWSYIKDHVSTSNFIGVSNAHKFKVFRKNTKFKRFNRGIIDFVRRKNIKRKRYVNYITLSFISSNWSKNYLNQRSILRFSQSLDIYNNSIESVEASLVTKLSVKYSYVHGLNTTSVPSKRIHSVLNNRSPLGPLVSSSNFSRNSIASVASLDKSVDNFKSLGLSSIVDSRNKFYTKSKFLHQYNLTSPFNATNTTTLTFVKCYQRIIVLTILYQFDIIN